MNDPDADNMNATIVVKTKYYLIDIHVIVTIMVLVFSPISGISQFIERSNWVLQYLQAVNRYVVRNIQVIKFQYWCDKIVVSTLMDWFVQ